MINKSESLVNDIKICSDELIHAIMKGKNQDGLDYVQKMKNHLFKIQQYLEMKESISKE